VKKQIEEILSPKVVKKAEEFKAQIINNNGDKIFQKYGNEAENIIQGRAINLAKKHFEEMKNTKLTELIKQSLLKSSITEQDVEVGADRYEEENELKEVSNLLDQLEELLKVHDWNYEYYDDYKKWKVGANSWAQITRIANRIESKGDKYKKDVNDLIKQYEPKLNENLTENIFKILRKK
jgi:hypothetical protein